MKVWTQVKVWTLAIDCLTTTFDIFLSELKGKELPGNFEASVVFLNRTGLGRQFSFSIFEWVNFPHGLIATSSQLADSSLGDNIHWNGMRLFCWNMQKKRDEGTTLIGSLLLSVSWHFLIKHSSSKRNCCGKEECLANISTYLLALWFLPFYLSWQFIEWQNRQWQQHSLFPY